MTGVQTCALPISDKSVGHAFLSSSEHTKAGLPFARPSANSRVSPLNGRTAAVRSGGFRGQRSTEMPIEASCPRLLISQPVWLPGTETHCIRHLLFPLLTCTWIPEAAESASEALPMNLADGVAPGICAIANRRMHCTLRVDVAALLLRRGQ